MKLTGKLFLSYLLIAAVSIVVLAVSTAYVAPADFSRRMMSHDNSLLEHAGDEGGMMWGRMQAIDGEIHDDVQSSVNKALWQAGIAATLTAMVMGLFMSRRIVNPIRALAWASQRIADGRYDERLDVSSDDELGDLTRHFNLMAEELAETEVMRRQLLGDVTHELKTPLASIKGYMEGLQDGVLPASLETFQLVHREADRLQRLVQSLQELSRTEAGQVELNLQTCDVAELLRTAVERLRPQFLDKEIDLRLETPDLLPSVRGDVDRTSQVLTNLLGNALQYTASGGAVVVRAAEAGDFVQISVEDNGAGLAEDDLKRVFQRFYRVDKSRSRRSGGSGIGLTIARHLVDAQGGKIWAESAGLGQGSTLYFTLPRG
jgi:signal transduction histidine kinase